MDALATTYELLTCTAARRTSLVCLMSEQSWHIFTLLAVTRNRIRKLNLKVKRREAQPMLPKPEAATR